MKEENKIYRMKILAISLMIGVAALWMLARFSLHLAVLCDRELWTEVWVYRLLGVEAAYAFAHCPNDFFPVLIYRTCLYGAGLVILAAVPIINFLVPNFRRKRGK